ncbi:CAF17-like 4Fe-4S cluster assembly/insertion protein YgfZ, partial [Vibrio parahaemolyticus]
MERCVSFEKGCYVGQEVLMRIHSRGQVHRRLHRFESPLPISPGDPLCGLDGVPLAEATSAIRRLDDLWIGLTFLRNETSTGELP